MQISLIKIAVAARNHGLMIRPLGNNIIMSPALTYKKEHCDELVEAPDKELTTVDR